MGYIQHKTQSGDITGATSVSVTLGAAVTSGNTVCGIVSWGAINPATTLVSVTDNQSNTYTIERRIVDTTHEQSAASFYKANITNAPTIITANFNGSYGWRGLTVQEVSGLSSNTPLGNGQLESAPGTGVDAINTGTVTTTVNGCHIFCGVICDSALGDGSSRFTQGTNFTERDEWFTSGHLDIAQEDRTQAAAGSVEGLWQEKTDASVISLMLAFEPSVAGLTDHGTILNRTYRPAPYRPGIAR